MVIYLKGVAQVKNLTIWASAWILPQSTAPLEKGAIVVEHDTIIDMGCVSEMMAKYRDAEVMDFDNSVIIPGLIDSHAHLSLTRFHQQERFANLGELMIQAARLHRAETEEFFSDSCKEGKEILANNGVTCVVDWRHCGILPSDLTTKIRHVIAYEVIGANPAKDQQKIQGLKTKICSHDTVFRRKPAIAVHSPYRATHSLWMNAIALAQTDSLPLMSHVAETSGEIDWIQQGKGSLVECLGGEGEIVQLSQKYSSPVAYMDCLGYLQPGMVLIHGVYLNRQDVRLLADRGIYVCLCPTSNMALSGKFLDIDLLLENQVRFILGTDSFLAKYDILSEAQQILNQYSGRDLEKLRYLSQRLLKACTLEPATAFNLSRESGRLAKGKKADFAVVEIGSHVDRWNLERDIILNGSQAITKVVCDGMIVSEK